MHRRLLAALAPLALLIPSATSAAEPAVSSKDLPRFPAVEPSDALKTFQIKPGFHLEIAASEPNVASPVDACFDENGRMFVVEMIDYPERNDVTPHLGRIRMLEDLDNDGVYEKSTVFADNLAWPTAVFYWNGGIFVGSNPDILYLKDTNGDGKADTREVVFSGFSAGMNRVNVQGMLNSFIWGLDNRIHGATSSDGGMVRSLKHPEDKPVNLHGRDFVIDPRSMRLTSEAGGGQHGLSFDDVGRRFACNNSDHIRLYMYDDRYASRNPFYNLPPVLESIAVDGPAAEVYRISPEEPWRVIRTRWRVAGLVSGPIEGGGRASGYFTGATGGTIYRGDAFPNGFLDNYFVGDAGGNLVHRKILTPDGVSLKAARPAGEQKIEFIASRDTWFRPVQFANAPDGTLYVIDMYREVIEHPWSLPDNLKKLLDLYSGSDRGRIYRITPDGFKRPPMPRLGSASAAELVAALESRNGWERDTASRLLYERQDKAAVPRLRRLLASSTFPLARLHALHALDGLGALNESVLLEALHDSAAPVREHAIKLSEKFMPDGRPSRRLLKQLQSLASDPDARVRYQLAFTLGEIRGDSKIKPLAAIARRDLDSSWTQAAILSSLAEGAGGVFQTLSSDPAVVKDPQGEEFLSRLAGLVGAQNRKSDVARVLAFLNSVQQPRAAFALALALSDGLHRAGSSLSTASDLSRLIAAAKKSAADSAVDAATRDSAIRLLGITTFADSGSMLLDLLNAKQPEPVQLASLAALSRFTDPELGPALAKSWPALGSRLRDETVAVLLARADRALALLNAIKAGQIRPAALTTAQAKMIRNYHDKSVRDLALKVLGPQHTASRQQVIEAYLPALQIKGDPGRGRKIYEARCISCHRVAGEGSAVGPDLVTVKNMGAEKILINVLDPNREVRPDYLAYFVETKDQESVVGLLANETPTTITLRQPYGKEQVINRSDIQQMKSQGQSLMPEGLEAGLKPQDLADLISFVEAATDKPLASSGK